MKRLFSYVMVIMMLFGLVGIVWGEVKAKYGTAAEAEAMVKRAIASMKSNGKEATFAEINDHKGKFTDGDLYIFVYDIHGKCVAHGQNPTMIGKDLIEMTDADGKYFVKERVEIAKTKGSGWQYYKFRDPLTKKIEYKRAYVERYEDLIVGCGIYAHE
ncbi:MAG: cache domain-containing protein [Thermodesulfovibrionales bacterium]